MNKIPDDLKSILDNIKEKRFTQLTESDKRLFFELAEKGILAKIGFEIKLSDLRQISLANSELVIKKMCLDALLYFGINIYLKETEETFKSRKAALEKFKEEVDHIFKTNFPSVDNSLDLDSELFLIFFIVHSEPKLNETSLINVMSKLDKRNEKKPTLEYILNNIILYFKKPEEESNFVREKLINIFNVISDDHITSIL